MFATFYTDKLSSILSSATYNNVGYAFIFNENGDVVLSNKKTDDFNNIESLNGIDLNDIDINGKGIINFRDENNTLNYLIYANIIFKFIHFLFLIYHLTHYSSNQLNQQMHLVMYI